METIQVTKGRVISSLFWKFLERGGTQGVQFVVSVILARLLLPKEYGVVSLITIFISIANVFVQSGLNTALIQKTDTDELDFSSVFFTSLIMAFILFVLLFFIAPGISQFYNEPVLILVIRVLSITLFFGSINSIQIAMVAKTMQFKLLFNSSLGAALGSGIIGVILAYLHFGVWALVYQQLINNALITFILWFTVRWRPVFRFSVSRVSRLFSFGWKLLCSSLIDTTFTNVYGLIIGKSYSSEMLGYYNRGSQFPMTIVNAIDGSIQSVLLPTLSARQDDKTIIKKMARRAIRTSSFVIMPMMFGMIAIARPLIEVLLTDKWLFCVPFLQLSCLIYALYPIHTTNLSVINSLGRSDLFLKLEVAKKALGVIILLVSIPFGIYVMVVGQVLSSFIGSFINAYPNRKLLGYSYKEQWMDILPAILLSGCMSVVVFIIGTIKINEVIGLFSQIFGGIVIYISGAKLFKFESYEYLMDALFISRKK